MRAHLFFGWSFLKFGFLSCEKITFKFLNHAFTMNTSISRVKTFFVERRFYQFLQSQMV